MIAIGSSDAFHLGILSSRIHVVWALAAGGTLEDRPRYNKTRCFEPFPFPVCDAATQARIRDLGERLDAHRKRQQGLFPKLTLTDMYNVLEKISAVRATGQSPLRGSIAPDTSVETIDPSPQRNLSDANIAAGARHALPALTAKEKTIHEQGLIAVLKEIHDDLDAAVFAAYGWPATLTDEEILERLVALNADRAAEEAAGTIHWLRPVFQTGAATVVPDGSEDTADDEMTSAGESGDGATGRSPLRGNLKPGAEAEKTARSALRPWPKSLPERVQAVRTALAASPRGLDLPSLAACFKGARADQLAEILDTLTALGLVRSTGDGIWTAAPTGHGS